MCVGVCNKGQEHAELRRLNRRTGVMMTPSVCLQKNLTFSGNSHRLLTLVIFTTGKNQSFTIIGCDAVSTLFITATMSLNLFDSQSDMEQPTIGVHRAGGNQIVRGKEIGRCNKSHMHASNARRPAEWVAVQHFA